MLKDLGLTGHLVGPLPHGVTAHSRTDGEHTYIFLENYSRAEVSLPLPKAMENMLTGQTEETATLTGYGFQIYRSM